VESEILFRALDRPEHVSNLLSLELTGAWVNEAREIPWAVIKALQGRVGRFPAVRDGGCVDPGLILDANPPDDDARARSFNFGCDHTAARASDAGAGIRTCAVTRGCRRPLAGRAYVTRLRTV
jgi:hypothetical protein